MKISVSLLQAVLGTFWLSLLTGCLFPLVILVLARLFFPAMAEGSLVRAGNVVVGSSLIGQNFGRPSYFHPRPSAAGAGYDGTSSGGTNLAPANPKLAQDVGQLAAAYRGENGLPPQMPLPIDAVTRSGSGLDPDISPENAALQVPRVARVRRLDEAVVRRLVAEQTKGRQFGFLGEPRVPVLALNLALDRLAPPPAL